MIGYFLFYSTLEFIRGDRNILQKSDNTLHLN